MARDIIILMRASPLQGTLEGVGLENRDFFGKRLATIKIIKSKASAFWVGPQKNNRVIDLPPSKSSPSAK
jgi:hypothetical protein